MSIYFVQLKNVDNIARVEASHVDESGSSITFRDGEGGEVRGKFNEGDVVGWWIEPAVSPSLTPAQTLQRRRELRGKNLEQV